MAPSYFYNLYKKLKMAQRKVYQAVNYQYLDTYVMVRGQKTLIQFRGGTLSPKMNGKYSTDDPDVIAALDEDIKRSGSRASFSCIHTEGSPDSEEVKKADAPKAEEPKKEAPEGDGNPPDDDPELPVYVEVPGITTVQAAKEYLLDRFKDEVKISHLANKEAVIKVATQKYVKFIDLK